MRRMMFRGALAAGAALIALAACQQGDAQVQQSIAIQGGTLIDGNGGDPLPNSVVVITDDRITAVGTAGEVPIPDGAQIIDASGKWVLPGLIDAKGNWNWQYGEPNLVWGVTSVIVSGGRNNQGLAERDAINNGVYRGPRLFQTGLTIAGSGANNDREDNYVPGDGNRVANSVEEAVAHVRLMHETGVDFITFQNGDGPYEIHAAAVAEAQGLGMAIDFRAMGPTVRAREVCEMGEGIVYVHTGNVGAQIAVDEEKWKDYIALPPDAYADMDEAKVQPMIDHLVGCNAFLEPDLMATARGFHRNWARVQQENRDFLNDENLAAYYPRHSFAGVIENSKSPETYLNPEQIAQRTAGFRNHAAFLKRFVDAGGKLVAASDNPQTHPGLGTHQELTAFVEDVGITPMQGIMSATSWVADGFKLEDLGRVEAGKLADVIVVDADPLADILNLRRVSTVIKNGDVVDLDYDPNYRGSMFQNRMDEDYDINVGSGDWAAALKEATWRPNARNGGFGNAGGIDSEKAPTPGIEAFAPHTVLRGSADTVVTVTGFNFVNGSKVTVDGQEVPTEVVSRTELRATIPAALFAEAGKLDVAVKNPLPLATPAWGDTSNFAHLLVPFEYTRVFPQPEY